MQRTGTTAHPTALGRLLAGAVSTVLLAAGAIVITTPAHAALVSIDVHDEGDLETAILLALGGDTVTARIQDDFSVTTPLPALSGEGSTMTEAELMRWADDALATLRSEVAAREPEWQAQRAAIISEADRVLAAFRASLSGAQP